MIGVVLLLSLSGMMASRAVRRYAVEGTSMLPSFVPGDRLMVESLSYKVRAPRPGDVVVVIQPGSQGRKDLKRIAAMPGSTVTVLDQSRVLGGDEWYVLGDNPAASTDSRSLGPVRRQDILGRVWFRY